MITARVLFRAATTTPDVLINANGADPVKPPRIIDQRAFAFGQNRVVGSFPATPSPWATRAMLKR